MCPAASRLCLEDTAGGAWSRPLARRVRPGSQAGPDRREEALTFKIVAFFSVLGEVQTLDLVFLAHTHAEQGIHDFENDKRRQSRQEPTDEHAPQLVEDLAGVAVGKPQRAAVAA